MGLWAFFLYICDMNRTCRNIMKMGKSVFGAVVAVVFVFTGVLSMAGAPTLPETDLSWKNVTVEGRASASHCLLLDSRGIVWVGTNSGLCWYDGIATHDVNEDKLLGAQIYAMVEHGRRLYLGTNHGLLSLDYDSGEVEFMGKGTPKEIRCMLLVGNELWIGSLYGVYIVDLDEGCGVDVTAGLPHKSTYSMLRDTRGIIYAGTFNGLAKWDSVKKTFSAVKSRPSVHKHQNLFVNCLMESDDGSYLYVGTEGVLYKYHIAGDCWDNIPELDGNNIKSLARVDTGHLLIGTDNGVYDAYLDTVKHYRHDSRQSNTLADNEIWCLLTDNDRNVWAGHDRGFSISSHSNTLRTLRLSSLAKTGDGNEIHCILRDSRGGLWLGGTNGAIRLHGGEATKWYRHDTQVNSLSHNRIRSIDEDRAGRIWLSTDAGLNRYDRERDQFDVFHVTDSAGTHGTNWVYTMKEDAGSYWVGGFLGGLHRVSKSKFDLRGGVVYSDLSLNADKGAPASESRRLENDLVNDVIVDPKGNVWILLFRDDVLACYDPCGDAMTRYDIFEMSGSYPSRIGKDRQGRIWCVFNGGAVIFDGNGGYKITRFADATEDEAVTALGAVGDDMWISTRSNLWKIEGKTSRASVLPIPQKAYTAIYEDTATNRVFLGGIDEILEINLANLSADSGHRGIQFVLVNTPDGKTGRYNPQASGEEITIPYGGNLSLIVSSLDYSPEGVHRYMYKLAATRKDTVGGWTMLPEGVNTISFTDLKMGDYELLIKRVGMTDAPVAIPLNVKAPILLSWWAILIYGLLAVGMIYGIVAYFQRKDQRRFREEERKKTLESIERKLTFLSDISHDLKTPLSMILGPVSLMKEKSKEPETRKALEIVYDNAVRLNNMIHKTIELHHLEDADDSLLILSTFDVVEFCKGVFETFKENHPDKNFIFHTECSELFIEGDAVKFESVMTNLFSNACKYSEEGATITCGISKQGDNVEIVVSDDGVGIEETDQPLVFQRMFRAPSTSKLREGTGLGLYLIKKYLELMKGTINLYSKKGQGTSFIITLPITGKEVARKSDNSIGDDKDKPKILIVEDNAEIYSFISTLLGGEYTVLSADNGRSGLAIASSFLPDLVIVDEMMPIMTGLEMCKRMKQIPRLSSIPIIMLTAKTDNQTENESVKLGIEVFMQKPFEPNVLFGRIRHLLKSRDEIREKIRIQTITETKPIEAESAAEKQLAKVAKIIEENISDPDLNVNFLCERSDIPQKQLYRLIKKYVGIAPLDYIRRVRLQKAAMLLAQKRFTVSEISYMVGFKTPSYFAKCFHAHFGVNPSMYKSDDDNVSNG